MLQISFKNLTRPSHCLQALSHLTHLHAAALCRCCRLSSPRGAVRPTIDRARWPVSSDDARGVVGVQSLLAVSAGVTQGEEGQNRGSGEEVFDEILFKTVAGAYASARDTSAFSLLCFKASDNIPARTVGGPTCSFGDPTEPNRQRVRRCFQELAKPEKTILKGPSRMSLS